jgi:hypothetical protein
MQTVCIANKAFGEIWGKSISNEKINIAKPSMKNKILKIFLI